MSFLTSTRVVRTALASAALLVLSSVAAPAAQAYNPDIDGDGIPNTWEMKGYDANGDGKIDVDYPGMGANPLKKDIFVEMDYMPYCSLAKKSSTASPNPSPSFPSATRTAPPASTSTWRKRDG